MPKKMNTDKAAAAVYQNAKAIEEAKKSGGLFGAVTKALGNRGFEITLRLAEKGKSPVGVTVQATPRKLFQGGRKAPIRIAVGHVVLLAGELTYSARQRPLEIVGRLDSKEEINELITMGCMSSAVLGIAETAGAVETGKTKIAEEDLFESDESGEEFWASGLQEAKGGLKEQRKAAETVATIAARVATLRGDKKDRQKGSDGSVSSGRALIAAKGHADELLAAELTVETLTPAEQAEFIRWRASQKIVHSARMAAGGGGPRVTVAQVEHEMKVAAQTAQSAAEQAAVRAEMESAAHVAELREFLQQRKVAENWDDEVNIEDL
jgi:hypothetical protein